MGTTKSNKPEIVMKTTSHSISPTGEMGQLEMLGYISETYIPHLMNVDMTFTFNGTGFPMISNTLSLQRGLFSITTQSNPTTMVKTSLKRQSTNWMVGTLFVLSLTTRQTKKLIHTH